MRKTRPKIETPFKCYICCTKGNQHIALLQNSYGISITFCCNWKTAVTNNCEIANGKVIGEFVCDRIYGVAITGVFENGEQLPIDIFEHSCLTVSEFHNYVGIKNRYGWHISELKIYDKPKELSEFYTLCEPNKRTKRCERCEYAFCTVLGKKPITRAPQSYMYVEELED